MCQRRVLDARRGRDTYLDVVVGELAVLVVVHAKELSLFRGAEVETRDHVNGLGDDDRHDEHVGAARDNVGNLDIEQAEVPVEETTGDTSVDAIQADNVVGSKEGVEKQTNNATDTVLSEHVEGVINADKELELGAVIAHDARDNAESNAGPGGDNSGSGSGGNESRDSARAPADEGPLLGKTVIAKAPSHGGEHGREAGVPAGHGGAEVGAKGRATVEAEPAEPEEDSADGDERDVVGAEVEHHLLVTTTENPRVGESRHTGSNLDGTTTGVIEDAVVVCPAIDVPGPAGNGAVDQCRPEEDKHHGGEHTTALSDGTDHEGGSDGAELHL